MAKVRIFSPFFPYPYREAAFLSVFNQIKYFCEQGHKVELVCWKTPALNIKISLQKLDSDFPRNLKITCFFRNGLLSGDLEYWQSLEELHSKKAHSQCSKLIRLLRSLVSTLAPVELQYYDPRFDHRQQLDEADLEVYHYSFSWAWLRKTSSEQRPYRVVHFHNIESDLFDLRSRLSNWIESVLHRWSAYKLRQHETKIGKYIEEVWQHSPLDLKNLELCWRRSMTQLVTQRLVSPPLSNHLKEQRAPILNEKLVVGFIGGLDYEPNYLSFKWIIDEVAPLLLKAQFFGEVQQVGRDSTRVAQEIEELNRSRILIKSFGYMENVEAWWQALSFLLVPDFTGAGVRVKILEAVASGIPVITNFKAVERLHPDLQRSHHLVVLETAEEWSDYLLQQKPFEMRKRLLDLPLNEGLNAKKIYEFVPGLLESLEIPKNLEG